jgi:hypothetical protein
MLLCGALYGQVQIDDQEEYPDDVYITYEPIDHYKIINDIDQILADLNFQRSKLGLHKLEYRNKYQITCNAWAKKMAKTGTIFHASSKHYKGETVALTQLYPTTVIPVFMKSPPHKKVLMGTKVKGVCIGVCQSPLVMAKDNRTILSPGGLFTVIRVYE